jgi:hypothetical protein
MATVLQLAMFGSFLSVPSNANAVPDSSSLTVVFHYIPRLLSQDLPTQAHHPT